MRNTEYDFVDVSSTDILNQLIIKYEKITGHTLQPADPDRLFVSWVADVIIQERVNQNYIGNQNIPSRAEGSNLDALGEWIYNISRKKAQPAKCTVRFNISEAQNSAISIPSGTRVSDTSKTLVWYTTTDALVPVGSTYADIGVQCETHGTIGNGYAAGQINQLIDIDNILFYSSCANITESAGGSDDEDDDTYYEVMRSSLDSHSTAGAQGSYIFWAKSVSDEIADVKAVCPTLTRAEQLTVFTDGSGNKSAFIGGDQIRISTLSVYAHGSAVVTAATSDYTVNYTNGLLTITITPDGALASETSLDVSFEQDRAGYVYIYALMNDGTIANTTIKKAIETACNDDHVRPLTDRVSIEDPQYVDCNIDCTYYVPSNSKTPLSKIQSAVSKAVEEYKTWQCEKLGRDINPSKLQALLMQAGIKRVEIRSPSYASLNNGTDGIPQVARIGTVTVTNGGYEDE